jgi:hypothetical protein
MLLFLPGTVTALSQSSEINATLSNIDNPFLGDKTMSQIIISDLEASQELDRDALNGVLGGKHRRGGHKNFRHVSYYREEYKETYKFKHYNHHNHCYDYHPCHFDYFHC